MSGESKISVNYQTVMVYLILKDAVNFVAFTEKVFGAKEISKTMRDEYIIRHAEIMIGETTIMLADATEEYPTRTAGFFIYVENADETFKTAIEAGATIISTPSDQPYGRSGGVIDAFGNTWWITSIITN